MILKVRQINSQREGFVTKMLDIHDDYGVGYDIHYCIESGSN